MGSVNVHGNCAVVIIWKMQQPINCVVRIARDFQERIFRMLKDIALMEAQ